MFRLFYSLLLMSLLSVSCNAQEEGSFEEEELSETRSLVDEIEQNTDAVLAEADLKHANESEPLEIEELSSIADETNETCKEMEIPLPIIESESEVEASLNYLAKIESLEGRVYLQYYPELVKKEKASVGDKLKVQDTIITLRGSIARLVFVDGTEVIMDEKSRLVLRSPDEFFQESGISYYDVQKKTAANTLNVRTGFALIGVKGTQFIVSVEETEEIESNTGLVSLREGALDIENPKSEDFEHHYFTLKEAEPMSEFERYQAEMMGSFETYKRRVMEEFVEYKKEFSLESGRSLSFNGARVDNKEMTVDDESLFKYFDSLK